MRDLQGTDRCGIVLAAGEGRRLQPLIRQWRGDDLPKQYVPFTGERSLLEQALQRAERLIPPGQIFTIIDRKHLRFQEVWQQLAGRSRGTVIFQPQNKETGPGILLPLLHAYKHFPEATVAIFPSDHYVREEGLFSDHVDLAFRLVAEEPSRLILLGMRPTGPETEYGYLLPGEALPKLAPSGARQVTRFIEKPTPLVAAELLRQGGLWNTMILVAKVARLWELSRAAAPELTGQMEKLLQILGTSGEEAAAEALYREIPSVNFSKALLERFPQIDLNALAVLPVRGVYWSDWGSIQRVMGDLRAIGSFNTVGAMKEEEHLVAR
ncbi:MAG: NTP transferase domain-containing protein [Nitrospirae bacterium]|nr:NTP transferase domain-containing protein [Candidatus Manganitrophaceae bacterium]